MSGRSPFTQFDPARLTLPSRRDTALGDDIPRIALVCLALPCASAGFGRLLRLK